MVDGQHTAHARRQRFEDLDPLGHQLGREARHAGEVAVGLREVFDEARGDRVGHDREDDRDRRRGALRGPRGDVAVGEDEVHRRLRELLRRRRQGDDVASREADVEAHVALLKSELFEPRP